MPRENRTNGPRLIGKKDIVSLNPDFNPTKAITRVGTVEKTIRQSKLVTEKIPIMVTQPIGEARRDISTSMCSPPNSSSQYRGPKRL